MVHEIKLPFWLHRVHFSLLPSSPSYLNCILKVISCAFACGCWFVTCLAWGSASLGHSHSPELKPTEKLINTQAPYKGLVLDSLAQPHICLCLGPQVPLTSSHTWEELQPACLKKYPPEGYPSRQNIGFDIKAEQQGWIVQFQAGLRLWVIRPQVECIICW